jgi:hypothetical protein
MKAFADYSPKQATLYEFFMRAKQKNPAAIVGK